jgi:hypothetical protein
VTIKYVASRLFASFCECRIEDSNGSAKEKQQQDTD